MRGTDEIRELEDMNHRITPACAGNSRAFLGEHGISGDHPRVCGEQYTLSRPASPGSGSPPRVRGTVSPPAIFLNFFRITPACAGNSSDYFGITCRKRDHPRVCGEQCPFFSFIMH